MDSSVGSILPSLRTLFCMHWYVRTCFQHWWKSRQTLCKEQWAATWQNQQSQSVRQAKTQISLGIRLVWSESSLSAWRKLGSLATHWAPRLIWAPLGAHSFYWFCYVAAPMFLLVFFSHKRLIAHQYSIKAWLLRIHFFSSSKSSEQTNTHTGV